MAQRGTVDINLTLMAWADIVLSKWHTLIDDLDVVDSGALDNSLLHTLLVNASQDIDKIEFSFKLYGQYVDMGVGKELSKGNSGKIDVEGEDGFTRGTARKAKPWFSKKYYGQIMKLREILMEQYNKAITYSMLNVFTDDLDQRFNDKLTARTVTSLRTVKYREKTNNRTMRNYHKRRGGMFFDGKWRPAE